MIKTAYVLQKFERLNLALDLGLEIIELLIEPSEHEQGGAVHIAFKPRRANGNFSILQSFEDLNQLSVFVDLHIAKVRKIIFDLYK